MTPSYPGAHPRARAGFTLVEMVVALTLMSLIGVAIFTSFRFAQRTYAKMSELDTAIADVEATQRIIKRLIESAYPIDVATDGDEPGLVGTRDALSVLALNGQSGHRRYHITLRPSESEALPGVFDVVVEIDSGNGARGTADHAGSDRDLAEPPTVLMTGVRALQVAYLPASDATNENLPPQWRDEWHKPTLPLAVRLSMAFDKGDRRRWPALVALPRVTADANCAFDVVSQVCRRLQ